MIAITSIAPKHFHNDIQQLCVNSWIEHGLKVFSFNNPTEAEQLKKLYPKVTFIETHRTMQHRLKKPYVQVNAALDWIKENNHENILIINSDIMLNSAAEKLKQGFALTDKGIAFAHRIDYETEISQPKEKMMWGLDIFFLNKKHVDIFPQTLYCFGQTHWDYWFPYTAKTAGLQVTEIDLPAYHKLHPTQWDEYSYFMYGQYAIWDLQYPHKALKKNNNLLKREQNFISSIMYNKIKGR